MNKKILVPVTLVFALAVLGGGYFYWSQNQKQKNVESPALTEESKSSDNLNAEKIEVQDVVVDSATKGTLPSIQTNPLEEKPDLNPVDKTNPYKDIKINPFK